MSPLKLLRSWLHNIQFNYTTYIWLLNQCLTISTSRGSGERGIGYHL